RRHYLSRDRLSPYVDLVAVDPDAQRRGIATALLQKSGLSLWEAGFRDVICAHIRRENTASVRLFRRHGFLLWQKDC
ncbi:GNAT family N-acetyltransferase, partial [Streptococcus pyogenes]